MKNMLNKALKYSCIIILLSPICSCQNGNTLFPAHCSNSVMDGNESGVDCGGSDCIACTTFQPTDQYYFSYKIDGVQKYEGASYYGYNSQNNHDYMGSDLRILPSNQSCDFVSHGPCVGGTNGLYNIGVLNLVHTCVANYVAQFYDIDSNRYYFSHTPQTFGRFDSTIQTEGFGIYYNPSFTARYYSSSGPQSNATISISSISQIFPSDTDCLANPYYIVEGTVNNVVLYRVWPKGVTGTVTLTDGHFRLINSN